MRKHTVGGATTGAVVLRGSARPALSLRNAVCGDSELSEKAWKLGDTDANQTTCTTENEGGGFPVEWTVDVQLGFDCGMGTYHTTG